MTIRGGRTSVFEHGTAPTRENGPAARSFAADAHDCIMVRINQPYRIQVCGAKIRPNGEFPLGSSTDRQAPSDAEALQKAPVAGHHRSACSGVKACPWL